MRGVWWVLLACVLARPTAGFAAVAYDNRTSSITSGFSHTVGATANLAVGMFCVDSGTITATSASIGGQSMTFQGSSDSPGNTGRCEVWTRVFNPPLSGAQTVSVSWSGSDNDVLTVWTFSGVDPVTPIDTPVANFQVSVTSVSQAVNSRLGDMVVDVVGIQSPQPEVIGANQIQGYSQVDGTAYEQIGSLEPGTTTVTMSWDWSTGTTANGAHLVVNVRAGGTRRASPLVVH